MKLLPAFKAQRQADLEARYYRDLIRQEAKIGGKLFGPVRPGGRREFFCLDEHTWIWHEEWLDEATGQRRVITTRYDIRPNGVLKVQDGQTYKYIESEEALHLLQAVKQYCNRVKTEVYGWAN